MGCDCNAGIPEQFADHDQVITDDLLSALAAALGITWPDWYRRFVLASINTPPVVLDSTWLPGGFLFSSAMLIWRDTIQRRTSWSGLVEHSGPEEFRDLPWPPTHIVVGGCGNGAIAIDTTSQSGDMLLAHREALELQPFLNISVLGATPEDAARLLKEQGAASDAAHRERYLKKLVNPFFRGPAAT